MIYTCEPFRPKLENGTIVQASDRRYIVQNGVWRVLDYQPAPPAPKE